VNMIFGAHINPELGDEVVVTVIATGFDSKPKESAQPQAQAQTHVRPKTSVIEEVPLATGNSWDVPAFMRRRGRDK
jgi:cell division protein FtsZ